jgi:hypothetical protein
MTHRRHSSATRAKIGASKRDSAWRHQQRNASGELQSPSPWDEDFSTPRPIVRQPRLWEEEFSA